MSGLDEVLIGYRQPVSLPIHRTFHKYMETLNCKSVSPVSEWGVSNAKYYIVDRESLTAIKLRFVDVELLDWRDDVEPDDDEEMRIMCRDCNGYVFSVSGYEWKDSWKLRNYSCRKKYGKCQYE